MGQKSSNWLGIPLCICCHLTDPDSIHNNNMDEGKLLAKTIQTVVQALCRDRMPF